MKNYTILAARAKNIKTMITGPLNELIERYQDNIDSYFDDEPKIDTIDDLILTLNKLSKLQSLKTTFSLITSSQ